MNSAIIALCTTTIIVIGCQGANESGRYIGCYKDTSVRALPYNFLGSSAMTAQRCIRRCRWNGHHYAGLQVGSRCWCGSQYNRYGPDNSGACSRNCTGEASQKCGGSWRNSVYTTGYVGCYSDSYTRAMDGYYFRMPAATATVDLCINACRSRGYKYAGLQHYDQCFCDNEYNFYGSTTGCNAQCRGNARQMCGGGWKNSVYRTGK